MKPGDFFVSLRQLLGILIPGSIWLGAVILGLLNQSPVTALSQIDILQGIIILGIIYLIGYSMRRTSFSFGIWVSDLLLKIRPLKDDTRRGLYKDTSIDALFKRAKTLITTQTQANTMTYNDKDIMEICKYHLLGETELSRRVEELEAEINLFASIILPLLFFCISLITYLFRQNRSFDFMLHSEFAGMAIFITYMMSSFARHISSKRARERRQILLMFLALTDLKDKRNGGK